MKYSTNIQEITNCFESYLKQIFKDPTSPKSYRRKTEFFINWVLEKGYTEIKYTEMMEYIRYCKELEMKPHLINKYIRAVRHFFDYLDEENKNYLNHKKGYNPARNIQIKGVFKSIRADYLNEEELETLIENYKGNQSILLGLLVYQGLKIGEIQILEKIHFDLKKGTVYIPKTIKGNSRILKLEAIQLYELMEHIMNLKNETLLGKDLTNQGVKLCKTLRKINEKVKNCHHLRGSRISFWVRNFDIREAQYLAGHKSIAGTEKYRLVNIEDLQNQVNKYHPLK
jgi:integrase/recombinase XerD